METTPSSRYIIEHVILYNLFYEDPLEFFEKMAKNIDYICSSYNQNKIFSRYSTRDFQFNIIVDDEKIILGRLSLPRPQTPPDCYEIYTYYNKITKKGQYITIESDKGKEKWICGWSGDGSHLNYASNNIEEFFENNYGIDLNNVGKKRTKTNDDSVFYKSDKDADSCSEWDNSTAIYDGFRFCYKCGYEIKPDAIFCEKCGARIR